MTTFLVMRRVGPAWDASLPTEQQSDWPAHADYIDELVENGVFALVLVHMVDEYARHNRHADLPGSGSTER